MMKTILSTILDLTLGFSSTAQITVTNTQTPNQLVKNVLLGFGVTATNITINGSAANSNNLFGNVTYFTSGSTTFPIQSGVLLTTGNGVGAIGPNNSGSFTNNSPATPSVSTDPALNYIANSGVTNGVVLEFDFVPSGDTISFNYLFGSDEYPEYSPSTFNDAFGFILLGPGISGPYTMAGYPAGGANLAVVPGTSTPVTINNVGPGATQNPTYYQNNLSGAAYGNAIQYDGTTTLLSANADVQCGQTYHIKLCISNVGDQAFDSGVFLQANSFSSEAVEIAVATVSGDTSVFEGCTDASLMFIRPQTQLGDTMIINYQISGTATMGADYNNLINPITFLPGEDTIVLTINPTFDGIPDNNEYVTITAMTISQCGDTAYYPTVQGTMTGSIDYYVTATNSCGYTGVDTVTVTLNQTLAVDTMMTGPATCEPVGWVSGMITGQTGVPSYQWTGPGPNNPNFIDASVWQNLSSGWYYFNVFDNVCEVHDSVFVDILNPPMAQFTATPSSGCSPLTVNLVNTSQNALNYLWDFGNGQTANVTTTANQVQIYNNSAVVRLIAAQGNCADTAYQTITVNICGCMDPNATNYNPLANFDDGSCMYPTPIVEAPNVFTPNSDNANDLFYLTTQNATSIELTILNRWGNVMYSKEGINPAWDGKSEGGALADEGVYFYKYIVKGYNDQVVEGHGFLHLVRK